MRDRGLIGAMRALARGPVTVPYPHQREQPVAGARGSVGFLVERCTACRRCVAACPTACLHIEGEEQPRPPAALREMWLDRGACVTCGACIEACPTGALVWRPVDELAAVDRSALVVGPEALRPSTAPPAPGLKRP